MRTLSDPKIKTDPLPPNRPRYLYNYLIIGGGPAGLYMARRLEEKHRKKNPNLRIAILETRPYLGGRTRQEMFHGRKVVTGAGVGRYPKDKILFQLCQEVQDKPVTPITTRICYQMSHPVQTLSYIEALKKKKAFILKHRSVMCFRDFFLSFFPLTEYKQFCESNGYTDFEMADIVDTLYDYGFEDNVPGTQIFYVPWNRMIRHLRRHLKNTTIFLQTEMDVFEQRPYGWEVFTSSKQRFYTETLIFAGSVEKFPFPEVRQGIGYNPFLRMYAFYQKGDPLHKGTTYTDNPQQKIISLSPRIQMVSYADNASAETVKTWTKAKLEKKTGNRVMDVKTYFWPRGTHFYFPLDTSRFRDRPAFIRYAQNPIPGIFLVGEVISKNQGWTEGAFESVEAVLPKM